LTVPVTGVLINDSDADADVLTANLVAGTTNGTLTLNPDGSFNYTPSANFNGSDGFTYRTNDGTNNSSTVTVSITVSPVNDAPVASNDNISTNEDVAVQITALSNDNDIDNAIDLTSVTIIASPAHGALSVNATTGVITFTPTADYNGNDSFTYTVEDVSGAVSNVATVAVTINPVNDVPVANNDNVTTPEDVAALITASANDTDVDDALDLTKIVVVTSPSHGTTSVNTTTGVITYTPTHDYFGNDSFTYTIKDVSGGTSNIATVTIDITSVNDAPVTSDDNTLTLQNTAVPIAVLANDSDVDNALDVASIIITQIPAHGSVSVNNTTGVVTYTPTLDYLGTDAFSYTVNDISGATSNVSGVTILVEPPNQPPLAEDDVITHTSLLSVTIDVMANDSDPDNTLDELSLDSVTQPTLGSVSIVDGKIVYHPEGTDQADVTFTYTISDPEGLTDVATVTVLYRYEPLAVSEGFSPNGDGNNDYWYIRSIDSYPSNSIKVFNRWGILVYEVKNYGNGSVLWDGRANTGMESGKLLEQGTYFYTVDLGNEAKTLSGYVVIVR
jgi:gliding motility-associated-like protein